MSVSVNLLGLIVLYNYQLEHKPVRTNGPQQLQSLEKAYSGKEITGQRQTLMTASNDQEMSALNTENNIIMHPLSHKFLSTPLLNTNKNKREKYNNHIFIMITYDSTYILSLTIKLLFSTGNVAKWYSTTGTDTCINGIKAPVLTHPSRGWSTSSTDNIWQIITAGPTVV